MCRERHNAKRVERSRRKYIHTPDEKARPLQVHSCTRTPSLLTRTSLTPMGENKILSHVPGNREKTIPWTNPSWSSFDRSSRVLPMVSGRRRVEKIPVSMKNANISRLERAAMRNSHGRGKRHKMYMCPMNLFVPPMFLRRWNPTWAMTAPNFPLAAEMPCAVDR